MNNPYPLRRICLLLALLSGWAARPAQAQAPAWQMALATSQLGAAPMVVRAIATDSVGNVYLGGTFAGQQRVGTVLLQAAGDNDVFVAKWLPATRSFAWALRGGSAGGDYLSGLAVSRGNVYLTGVFGGATAGFGPASVANANGYDDIFVAKLHDAGASAAFVWAQRAGSLGFEASTGIAVQGSSVYVVGRMAYSSLDFGPLHVLNYAGVNTVDGFVAKLTDAGSSGSWAWATNIGGPTTEVASCVAVSGANVYVGGWFQDVRFYWGNAVLTSAANSYDAWVGKLTDTGPAPSFGWIRTVGGTGNEGMQALAVRGAAVYVAGDFSSPTLAFDAATVACRSTFNANAVVARLTDAGSTAGFDWAYAAGGDTFDRIEALTTTATDVYVAGTSASTTCTAGSTTVAGAGYYDIFVARLPGGPRSPGFAWLQHAGGPDSEWGNTVAVHDSTVYVGGGGMLSTAFGPLALAAPSDSLITGYLASLHDLRPTATRPATRAEGLRVYPSPAPRNATVSIRVPDPATAQPADLRLLDGLGRTVRRQWVPAQATEASLDLTGLAPSLYLVRCGAATGRLVVE